VPQPTSHSLAIGHYGSFLPRNFAAHLDLHCAYEISGSFSNPQQHLSLSAFSGNSDVVNVGIKSDIRMIGLQLSKDIKTCNFHKSGGKATSSHDTSGRM
jgi:hypothetical protein